MHRLRDTGEGSLSYIAIVLLIAAVTAAVTVVAVPDRVTGNIQAGICRVIGTKCDPSPGPGTTSKTPSPGSSDTSSPGASGDPNLNADDPGAANDPAYQSALDRANNADTAATDSENGWGQIGDELLSLVADLVGFTDAKKCLTEGDIMACLMTLITALPIGRLFKALRRVPKAAKIIERLIKAVEVMNKARKEKLAADAALQGLRDALSKKVEAALAKLCTNSFVPGTPVLMADGTHRAIERVKVGDLVLAADPKTGRNRVERVTAAFGGTNYEKLMRVVVATGGGGTGVVIATEHHRFWDERAQDWRRADQLTRDEVLRSPDGSQLRVLGADSYPGHPEVRDLTVEELHTFYVQMGGVDVLVHNAGACYALRKLKGPDNAYQSPGGLIYTDGSRDGHRLLHVLRHGLDNPDKSLHSIFNVTSDKLLQLVDDAWAKRYSVTPIPQYNGNKVYIIPMGRVVGTQGEKYIRIVVESGQKIVTAFPQIKGTL